MDGRKVLDALTWVVDDRYLICFRHRHLLGLGDDGKSRETRSLRGGTTTYCTGQREKDPQQEG